MPSTSRLVERVLALVRQGEGFAGVVRARPGWGRTTLLRTLRDECHGAAPIFVLWPSDDGALRRAPGELVDRLARRLPVLLLVDDVHWAEAEAVAPLAALADRVGGLPLGMVLTAPVGAALPAGLEHFSALELPELEEADVLELLGKRAPAVTSGVAEELLSLCGGHPLVLREFLPSLDDEQLRGRAPLPREVGLGAGSLTLFRQPWATLPKPTKAWLQVLALSNDNVPTCVRAARRLGLGLGDLVPAEHAGVVRVSPVGKIHWRCPLVRSAVVQSATLIEAARTCAALAEVTSPDTEPVEHPRWLARSLAESPALASALDSAVTALVLAGRLLDAYELAGQAAEAATEGAQRQRYRVLAAELCWLAGYGEHALRLLDQLVAPLPVGDVDMSARVLRRVIEGLRDSWPSPAEPLGGASVEACGHDQLARSLGTALLAGWETVPAESLAGVLARLDDAYQRTPPARPGIARALATVVAGNSDPGPAERAALRTVSWWHQDDDPLHPKAWPPPLLPVFIGEEAGYARQFTELLATPHVHAARSTRAILLLKLATAQAALGHWPHAMRSAEACWELAEELRLWALHSDALTIAAWVCAARGHEDDCLDLLGRAHRQQGRAPAGQQPWMAQWVQGLLRLSVARPLEAHDALRPLHTGAIESPQHLVVRRLSTVDFVEASVGSRRPVDAERAVDQFAEWVSGGAADWARVDLARCRALLEPAAEQWHRESLDRVARVGRLATSARVELSFGSWLRRHKRHQEARPHLRNAERYFDRLAAPAWRDRAHAELRAAGESGPTANSADGALTAQELRIARLAAAGRSNREIAESLGLSPRTVGYHLYKIFPKLDISSRTQLPMALGAITGRAGGR